MYDNVIFIESNNIKLIVAGCFFYVGNDAVYESVTQMEETGEGTVYFLNIKEQYKIWKLFDWRISDFGGFGSSWQL